MTVIPLIRLAALSVVVAFSVIVLGLSAALTSTTEKYLNGYFEFAALAIATSVITMITVPIMIVMEFLHHGAMFTSMVLFELSWLSILWVLWLATAADTTQANAFISGCDYISDVVNTACRETQAVQAFSFLNWLILMAYTILILVLSIIAHSRQHTGVWRSSVAEAPFFTPGAGPAIPPATSQPETAQPASYGPSTVSAGGYETQHTAHHLNTSEGGTGPASVQAGTVHQV